ncbi:MAG: thioredoxin family protein [Elusimicrobia bacterium]|nr:thioredoxin family protein [Elusimicrobiota bacterium]
MSKIVENEPDFDKTLSECSSIFVLFYASWCPYCQEFLPVFEKHSKKAEHKFCRVVVDRTPELEEKYSIEVVPTVIYFENGKAVKRLDGIPGSGLTEHHLNNLILSCKLSNNKNP